VRFEERYLPTRVETVKMPFHELRSLYRKNNDKKYKTHECTKKLQFFLYLKILIKKMFIKVITFRDNECLLQKNRPV